MAPVGTLWGSLRTPLTKMVLSVAALNELELDQPEWSFANKPAEFTSKFPYGKIPAFEGSDGFKLMEGASIARYLCSIGNKVNLLGSDAKESILVDQWIHFAEQEIGVPTRNAMTLIFGFAGPFNRETLDKQIENVDRAMQYVESYLETRTSGYLVSDSLTLADIALAAMSYGTALAALGEKERAKYPAVFAHYTRVTENDKLRHLWGTEHFTKQAVTEPKTPPGRTA